ncbi:uncharacterized protein LOC102077819 [Oreochromis niloticus]|uniref:uncharacterized protein LOC102077819 n=1 Tax=Oreochromis niloticus TaxID=8128 RepID=UPI000905AF62|nr:uncharacterized protein LOC102077819 [Oreochromis niloticus]
MLLFLLLLISGSQHSLAEVVEVYKEATSVLVPCQYSGIIPENNPTVMWARNDLDPKCVHLRLEEGDDLKMQNQRYRGRTSMTSDALETADFSLTLRKPELSDSGIYTCSISDGREKLGQRNIELKVKDHQVKIKVEKGSHSVILPCKTTPELPDDTRVEWTHLDVEIMMVHVYSNKSENLKKQDDLYCGRTKMNKDLLRTGDLSLTLKYPTERDSGGYICTIYRDKDILRQKVVLQVKEPFPSWAIALIILLVLLVSGGLLFYFRHYFMSGYKVVVDSGVESVQLPCKIILPPANNAKVEWQNRNNRIVHVYENGSDQPGEQDEVYRDRTKMKRNLLEPGDFSLTLKYPTDKDTNTYTCTVYNRALKSPLRKNVELIVRVPEVVKVDSGKAVVELPCKATVPLPEDAKVEWIDGDNDKVHVYQNGSDQPDEQDQIYRDRTKMNKDLLKTSGDVSLTLKYPTDNDITTYTCTVYNSKGNVLMKKQVMLKVKVHQQEETSGKEFVKLPFNIKPDLLEGAKVEWTDKDNRKVQVYHNTSDLNELQHRFYRHRTEMNEGLIKAGDLNLTLKHPTDWDSGIYTCTVYNRYRKIRMKKQVELKVRVCQVEVEEGAESVQLPFKTTENLPEDAKVEWRHYDPFRTIYVYQNGSDQPDKQDQAYVDRIQMNEDLLKTGDLSLTLKQPTVTDSGEYRCEVDSTQIYRYKTVLLKVKGRVQVQDQTGDIRNRSSSIDPTPLMADQSV